MAYDATGYDVIVIGAGVTGAALSYELTQAGAKVLLIEQQHPIQGATHQSYGGIAYWAGDTALTRTLCAEGIAIHRQLSDELEAETEFRELELLLTIDHTQDPQAIAAAYGNFAIAAEQLTPKEAQELEPLLNPAAISGALRLPHGHVHPVKLCEAYVQAMVRRGGQIQMGTVQQIQVTDRAVTVTTDQGSFVAERVVVCAGAMSRELLKQSGFAVKQYFSYAESIEIPPVDLRLRTIVMDVEIRRFALEAQASTADLDPLWEESDRQLVPPVMDAGALQFADGSLRLGQISRTITNPYHAIDQATSEPEIRNTLRPFLPAIADLPGTWRYCTVAFSRDHLPLIGPIAGLENVLLFSGFSNPLVLVPPLARRFAKHLMQTPDPLLDVLTPRRFEG